LDVAVLQQALRDSGHSVEVDGVFGRATASAVKAMFASLGVQNDGSLARSSRLWLPAGEVLIETCPVGRGSIGEPGLVVATTPQVVTRALVSVAQDEFVPGPRALQIGGLSIDLDSDLQVASTQDLGQLATILAERQLESADTIADTIDATVTLRKSIKVYPVPPTSLVFGDRGVCVVSNGDLIEVEILGSTLGQSLVQFSNRVPSRIELRPAAPSCD
jgi:peptidoglycan hydrolase-like protein with peptidoglycan-binding domain